MSSQKFERPEGVEAPASKCARVDDEGRRRRGRPGKPRRGLAPSRRRGEG